MFGDGADSNANIALSAALRQQLQITCIPRPYDHNRSTNYIYRFGIHGKLYFSAWVSTM